ncbi:Carbonyl reductase family member 4 [Lecanosticta acicola]|uniref:Carbonyl reductase family member 4 n=1 Tax=Lecanosticta acicola TaxID=111012 RepID=A0AAI9EBY5_9PEZI|nr:Carbonyl reductase family member 4 [Lecanosticta acicola]
MAALTDSVPFSVDGKTALITGAGSGINYCFAKLLLSRNCNVVIADLGLRPEAQELVDKYTSKAVPRAIFVKTDVTIWDDLTNAFDKTDREFGGADIVCPGAGVYEPEWSNFWIPPGSEKARDPIHGAEGIGHYATLDINVTHPIRATQLAISRWLNPPAGSKCGRVSATNPKRIIHITSVAGQVPGFLTPLYQASKHAISGFIRSLAPLDQNLAIRVNGVAPGVIRTPLWTEHPEKMLMLKEEQDEWVEPEEVAEAMLRCCEDDMVDGGYVMEVLKGRTRHVDWKMDPGPQGPGFSASNRAGMIAELLGSLAQPGWGVAK